MIRIDSSLRNRYLAEKVPIAIGRRDSLHSLNVSWWNTWAALADVGVYEGNK
jgi:hypothetical protein